MRDELRETNADDWEVSEDDSYELYEGDMRLFMNWVDLG
jgi:hypothetical protein